MSHCMVLTCAACRARAATETSGSCCASCACTIHKSPVSIAKHCLLVIHVNHYGSRAARVLGTQGDCCSQMMCERECKKQLT